MRTIDRVRLKEYIGRAGRMTMQDVDHAIAVSFGLDGILFPEKEGATGGKRERLEAFRQTDAGGQKGAVYGKQETGMGILLD